MRSSHCGPVLALMVLAGQTFAVDGDGNRQSDVWEMLYQAQGLPPDDDADGDGWTNESESVAGTNPLDSSMFPKLTIAIESELSVLSWFGLPGKRYMVYQSADLSGFQSPNEVIIGRSDVIQLSISGETGNRFYRLHTFDADSDGDGVTDWEELMLGFDPQTNRSGRSSVTDLLRVQAGLAAGNLITVACYDDTCSENWSDPAVLVVRRSGGLQPLSVAIAFGGTAIRGQDYQSSISGNLAEFAAGQREVFVEISALADADENEANESVTLTVLSGSGYSVVGANWGVVAILNETAASGPSPKEAARFLIQAAFGPDQDLADDVDQIPENVEEVMLLGFEAWIDEQLARPVGTLRPMVQWQNAQPGSAEIYNDRKQNALWGRMMGLPKLRPDAATTQLPDPLRQRVGFALSQIFVISDRMERLGVEPEGMVHFYDTLLHGAFLNFEDLLRSVALHSCMGIYLSHLGNRKSDPLSRTFPDENFAREIMQLFSIGLWMLNPDGSHLRNEQGQPIPTYGNQQITEIAKIFTGLSFGQTANGSNNINFGLYDGSFTAPMKGWDEFHDLGPKTLLLGATTPQRMASSGNTGSATMADVDALISNLFNHPNVGPFLAKLLIQRLITSNPSAGYISRVAAAFDATPRGDLGRTVKAIYLDPEARDPAMMADPTFGKLREPFLKAVNVARAFNASAPNGWYYLDAFILDHAQEPLKAPSVFNFYLPTYTPPGSLANANLVAPEFQIINASSGVTAPNYFWGAITGGLHRWGASADKNVRLNLTQEMLLNVPAASVNDPSPSLQALDPDSLIRRLDLVLTGGTLTPRSFQIIREALLRIGPGSGWEWPKNRLKLAIYLIVSSPEFAVQH